MKGRIDEEANLLFEIERAVRVLRSLEREGSKNTSEYAFARQQCIAHIDRFRRLMKERERVEMYADMFDGEWKK